MTAHRYWRINITSNAAGSYASMAECVLAGTIGGATLCGTGTATADSYYPGQPPASACDGSTTTSWCSNGNSISWWQYDFGVGVTQDIQEVRITPPGNGFQNRAPRTFDLQYSDNGTTWVTLTSYTAARWVGSTAQAFSGSAPPLKQIWRLLIVAGVDVSYSLAEVQFRPVIGTPHAFTGGTPSASEVNSTYVAANACDGSLSTYWASNDTLNYQYWQYDYGVGNGPSDIAEVTITARNDAGYTQTPTTMLLQYSDGVGGWVTRLTLGPSLVWTQGQTYTFNNLINTVAIVGSTAAASDASDATYSFATPVPGNILVCIQTHHANTPGIAAGWTELLHINTAMGNSGVQIAWSLATALTSTTQTPFTSTGGSAGVLWEISGASPLPDIAYGAVDLTANPSTGFTPGVTTYVNELVLAIGASDISGLIPSFDFTWFTTAITHGLKYGIAGASSSFASAASVVSSTLTYPSNITNHGQVGVLALVPLVPAPACGHFIDTQSALAPIHQYGMADAVNIAYDSGTFPVNGAYAGTVSSAPSLVPNIATQAKVFGTNARLNLTFVDPPQGAYGAFSIEFLFETTSTIGTLLANAQTNTSLKGFQFLSSSVQIAFSDGVHTISYPTALVVRTTYHFVLTFDGSVVTLWINGLAVGTAGPPGTYVGGTNCIAFGYNPSSNGSYTPGIYQAAAFYNFALTPAQVAANYAALYPIIPLKQVWRLCFLASNTSPFSIAELQFRQTAGVPQTFSGGTASVSVSEINTSYPPTNAYDGNLSTCWASVTSVPNQYWQYDYGTGNGPSDIQEVAITARNDSYYTQTPSQAIFQYSDGSGGWVTRLILGSVITWTQGQTQVFNDQLGTPVVETGFVRELLYTEANSTLYSTGFVREMLRSTGAGGSTWIGLDGIVREMLRSTSATPLPVTSSTVAIQAMILV